MEKSANATFEELAPRRKSARGLVWVILIVLVVLIGWWWFRGGNKFGSFTRAGDGYQAVFLTNNQVYFGKLAEARGNYAVLTDIFYLQVSQPLQPSPPAGGPNPNVNLIKLGSELHGPVDRMEINRDQILFIETLDSTPVEGGGPRSQVLRGIEKYKTDNKPK